MFKHVHNVFLVLALAGCGAGGNASQQPVPRTPGAVTARAANRVGAPRSLLSAPGVTLAVNGSGTNYSAYAVNLATKPVDTTDVIVCYVAANQVSGTLAFTGGAAWTVVGGVSSSEPTQQIVAYRNATAADITGQTYTATTTTAVNKTAWLCDIVQGGFAFQQVVTGSQGVTNGTLTLATATPSTPGQIFLGFLGEDRTTSQSFGIPSTYSLLATDTANFDTWNFAKIKSATDSTVERPSAASAYTGSQPWALSALVALTPPTSTPPPAAISQDGNDSQIDPATGPATLTLPTTSGDAQIVFVASSSSGATFTVPSNFTLIDGSTSTYRAASTYCASSSLTANPVFSASAGRIAALGVAFKNASCSLDGHSIAVTGNANVSSASAVSPTVTGDALVFMAMNDATTKNVTAAPSGLTEAAPTGGTTGSFFSQRDYYKINPALSAQQPSLTWNYVATGNYALTAYVVLKANGGVTPTPTPSPAPTPTPSPTPSALANGAEWPASFQPYAATSPWNLAMTNTVNPTLYANSDTIIANMINTGDGAGPAVHTAEQGGGYGYGHPVYFASTSDPSPTPSCQGAYCGPPPGFTSPFKVAPRSRPVDGSDHHMTEIAPDGTENAMWRVSQVSSPNGQVGHDWVGSDTIYYAGGGPCTNFYSGSGFNNAGLGMTDIGSCGGGGTITESQMAAGNITHRLFVSIACVAPGTFVFPGYQNGDHPCSGTGPHVPMGALLWSDISDSAVNALAIPADGKTLLRNLHDYGWFVGDTQCSANPCPQAYANFNLGLRVEPDVQFSAFSVTPPMQTYASANGWNPVTIGGSATRWILCDPCTWIDWRAHLHIVDPCYAQGTC